MNTRLKLLVIIVLGSFAIIFNIFLFFFYFSIERKSLNKEVFEQNAIDLDLSLFKKAIEFSESRTTFSFESDPTEQESSTLDSTKPSAKLVSGEIEEFNIQILNGSGISGAASGLKEELEKNSQFEINQVGNTDNTQSTIVKSKSSVPESTKTLIYQIIEKNFPINQKEILSDDNASDIIIILGQN
ncbi:LytR C-terminal domain-containing protein [Patescibacteria group bacterium]|nr:LytR C-terminal domain-containing protein [Patescibacteria group bacterium]